MKKILAFLFVTILGVSLVGCGDQTRSHKHTFANTYSSDETYHWYAATCEHESEVKDKEEHKWDDGEVTMEPTENRDGEKTYTCSVCKATKTEEIEFVYRDIEVDYVNGALYVPAERKLKVAQFADAHFGVDGKDWHNDKLERSKEYMRYVVETSNPDFIVCSGDNVIGTGITNGAVNAHDLTEFVTFMESLKTPWTFMYGNHDAETKSKAEYSQFLLNCVSKGTTKYLLYKEDYIEVANASYSSSDEGRYGNFTIPVYDIDNKDKLLGAYMFLDSGTYLYDLGRYQTITEGQVNWYQQQISSLNQKYQGEGTVPTIVFTHIQLPEHAIAYNKAYYKDDKDYEFVVRQDEIAADFTDSEVSSQSVTTDSGLFNKMVELGSTKAVFVGHAHSYAFQVKSHGILLGYAPQCGFSKLFESNDDPRCTYVYNVNSDFTFTSTKVLEAEDLGEGLTVKYFDGTNGDKIYKSTYDATTGLYTLETTLYRSWARVRLYFNNQVISTDDKTYTFAGDYQNVCDTTSYKLYPGTNPANLFYPNSDMIKCVITFDPDTKTVNIDTIEPEIPENVITRVVANKETNDDQAVVWTNAGTVYKSADGKYPNASMWRMVIVVDSQGRIAYMCAYITNGYGGATGSGYIRHSMYSNYKTNPAFSYLSAEYEGKWGTTCDWTLAVPEGGFMITCHGNTKTKLAQLITGISPDTMASDGVTPTHKDATINKNSINVDNIRIVYDSSSKTITVNTVEN